MTLKVPFCQILFDPCPMPFLQGMSTWIRYASQISVTDYIKSNLIEGMDVNEGRV
jgi:hypothetical protein